jgi:hypothetical protein
MNFLPVVNDCVPVFNDHKMNPFKRCISMCICNQIIRSVVIGYQLPQHGIRFLAVSLFNANASSGQGLDKPRFKNFIPCFLGHGLVVQVSITAKRGRLHSV